MTEGEMLFEILTGMTEWRRYSQFTWNESGIQRMIEQCESIVNELDISIEQIERIKERVYSDRRAKRKREDIEDMREMRDK